MKIRKLILTISFNLSLVFISSWSCWPLSWVSQRHIQSSLGALFSAGILGVAMMPPMGPEQSPGGSLVGKAPRSPEDLILCNDLHLLKSLGLVSF